MLTRTLPRLAPTLRTRTTRALASPAHLALLRPLAPRIANPDLALVTRTRFASTSTTTSSTPQPPPPPPNRAQQQGAYQRARHDHYRQRNRSLLLYSAATILVVTAGSYLAVPLYRVFCSTTGYAGTPQTDQSRFVPERLVARTDLDRRIRVTFNADSSDSLPWSFEPQQRDVRVLPGETALAFYTATNHSDDDIVGIATYNVTPNSVRPALSPADPSRLSHFD